MNPAQQMIDKRPNAANKRETTCCWSMLWFCYLKAELDVSWSLDRGPFVGFSSFRKLVPRFLKA